MARDRRTPFSGWGGGVSGPRCAFSGLFEPPADVSPLPSRDADSLACWWRGPVASSGGGGRGVSMGFLQEGVKPCEATC